MKTFISFLLMLSAHAWASTQTITSYFSPQDAQVFFDSIHVASDHGFKRLMTKNSSLICYISDMRFGKIHKLECQLTVKLKDVLSFQDGIAFTGELSSLLWESFLVERFTFDNSKLKTLGPLACLQQTQRRVKTIQCSLRL